MRDRKKNEVGSGIVGDRKFRRGNAVEKERELAIVLVEEEVNKAIIVSEPETRNQRRVISGGWRTRE